uniref:hypothetical protein n=1 Tax=Salmonella sp. TaxID=599 RepID=UPI001CDA0CED|nr:hypothetical protein [Salmonella sp.]
MESGENAKTIPPVLRDAIRMPVLSAQNSVEGALPYAVCQKDDAAQWLRWRIYGGGANATYGLPISGKKSRSYRRRRQNHYPITLRFATGITAA